MFKGVGTALITPFKDDLSVDLDSIKKIVRNQLENKIDALIVLGTTGESPVINYEERRKIISAVAEEASAEDTASECSDGEKKKDDEMNFMLVNDLERHCHVFQNNKQMLLYFFGMHENLKFAGFDLVEQVLRRSSSGLASTTGDS